MSLQADLRQFRAQQQTRRAFLGRAAQGVGKIALASLLNPALLSLAAGAKCTEILEWRRGTASCAAQSQAGHLAHDGGRSFSPGDF